MAKRRDIARSLIMGKPFGELPTPHPSRAQIVARAANLKKAKLALWRKRFQAECRAKRTYRSFEHDNPGILVDRVKVDMEGEFRLAALKRVPKLRPTKRDRPKTTVKSSRKIYYTQIDPIEIYPIEFRAAQMLEPEDIPNVPSPAFIAFMRESDAPKLAKGFKSDEAEPPDKG